MAQSSLQQELVRGNPLIAGKFAGGSDFQARIILICSAPHVMGGFLIRQHCLEEVKGGTTAKDKQS